MVDVVTLAVRHRWRWQAAAFLLVHFPCYAFVPLVLDAPAELCLIQVSAAVQPIAENHPKGANKDSLTFDAPSASMVSSLKEAAGLRKVERGKQERLRKRKRNRREETEKLDQHRHDRSRGGPGPAPSPPSHYGEPLVESKSNSTGSYAALTAGAGVGALVTAFTGSCIGGPVAFGLRAGMCTAVAGAIVGGLIGWLVSGGGQDLIPGLETHEVAEPYTEKLHELALTILAITASFKSDPKTYNESFKAEVRKDLEDVRRVLQNIEAEIAQGIHATPDDFHIIEEILTHQKYAVYLSAEAAAANEEVITAHDAALIEALDDLSKMVQPEDLGPAGSLDSYEGDMIPGAQDQTELIRITEHGRLNETMRATAAGPLWDDGKVFYCYAPDVPVSIQHIFEAALKDVNYAVPCIQFFNVGHQSGNSYDTAQNQRCKAGPAIFVQSNPKEGCYSYVGMIKQWQSQKLQLQYPGCNVLGIAVHELQHALGIAHEQARPDRGHHVRINWANIQRGTEHNFEINNNAHVRLQYDFLSNMHYDAFAFAVDKNAPTIIEIHNPEHTANEVGQRVGLAKSDIVQLEQMYTSVAELSCYSNSMTGLGCIDQPNNNGQDYCSGLTSCSAEAVGRCCACGGGVKIQCYENMECPKADPLPPPAGAECIIDKSNLFPAGTGCVFTNRCAYSVKWKCPGLSCTHITGPGGYWQTSCGATPQTQICTLGACDVWQA